jgi:hypothetical protein
MQGKLAYQDLRELSVLHVQAHPDNLTSTVSPVGPVSIDLGSLYTKRKRCSGSYRLAYGMFQLAGCLVDCVRRLQRVNRLLDARQLRTGVGIPTDPYCI